MDQFKTEPTSPAQIKIEAEDDAVFTLLIVNLLTFLTILNLAMHTNTPYQQTENHDHKDRNDDGMKTKQIGENSAYKLKLNCISLAYK